MFQSRPGAPEYAQLHLEILECQDYTAHGDIGEDDVICDDRQDHQIEGPVLFQFACGLAGFFALAFMADTLFTLCIPFLLLWVMPTGVTGLSA
jgi:hypothetical protein